MGLWEDAEAERRRTASWATNRSQAADARRKQTQQAVTEFIAAMKRLGIEPRTHHGYCLGFGDNWAKSWGTPVQGWRATDPRGVLTIKALRNHTDYMAGYDAVVTTGGDVVDLNVHGRFSAPKAVDLAERKWHDNVRDGSTYDTETILRTGLMRAMEGK